jgi:hypothetical protein
VQFDRLFSDTVSGMPVAALVFMAVVTVVSVLLTLRVLARPPRRRG